MTKKIFYIALCTMLFALCLSAEAQQPAPVRIGWISNDSGGNSPMFDAFRDGMRELGYVEGRNVIIEPHWGEGSNERLERLAVELVRSNPQVIVTQGGPATYPVVRAGATMPIVFGFSGDPVEGKLVESFARPGRNLTGVSLLSLELVGKRMELLKEVIPGAQARRDTRQSAASRRVGRVTCLKVRGQTARPRAGIFSTSRHSQT